ncbi:hypothetical protein LTR84_003113 [Exophiala bonariae]|uniref:Uncharacterized protein n=1 Tax=Exophiala bonariae TaxID=1690606 RepID=A0AAV9N7X0_9EURO|nr:hypothetical protein LTR84_003113 [Exophiala bonariae]
MAQILLNESSSYVRLALRVYFNITLPLAAAIGDQCCRRRSQLQMMKKNTVDATQTTGWLRGTSAAYVIYSMRRSPAGFLGVIMILASLLWFAADLVVSTLVMPVMVVDRCPFNTTNNYMVPYIKQSGFGPMAPSNLGALWDTITRATFTSQSNGGLTGIFKKANGELNFRADADDIIGRWNCTQDGKDVQYNVRVDPNAIFDDLVSRNQLFGNYSGCETSYIGKNWYTQVMATSSSVGDWSQELSGLTPDEIINSPISHPWDVRAAVDMSPNATDEKLMRTFLCTLDAPSLEYQLGKIQAITTLTTYCNNFRASIYQYFTDNVPMPLDPGVEIASILDIIVMMSVAYQAGNNNPPPEIPDLTQGCLATKTRIPAAAILIFILATVFTIGLTLYLAVLLICLRTLRQREAVRYELVVDNTPNGLLDWIRQAVITTGEVAPTITHPGLKNWSLTPSYNYQCLQLMQTDTEPEYQPVRSQLRDQSSTKAQDSNLSSLGPAQLPKAMSEIGTSLSLSSPGPWQKGEHWISAAQTRPT